MRVAEARQVHADDPEALGRERRDGRQERRLGAAEAVDADERSALAGAQDRKVVVGGADALEAKPLRVGVAARRSQEADAEVEVLADPQAARAIGRHAGADVARDLVPDRRLGSQDRVRVARAGGRDQPRDPALDQSVEGCPLRRRRAGSAPVPPGTSISPGSKRRDQLLKRVEAGRSWG